jgi:hypothetical protein
MSSKARFASAFVALTWGAISPAAQAGVVQIFNPDAAYTSSTTNLPITGADFVSTTSLTNGAFTMTFSPALSTRTVPTTWASWSSPPNSESATPRVLTTQHVASITIGFSSAIEVFGVEVEPDSFAGLHDFTASFFDGVNLVGAVTRDDLVGNAGARLLAATATGGDEFTSVTISTDSGANGFGLAQFRFALDAPTAAVPEPSALALLGAAFAAFGLSRKRKKL